MGGRERSAPCVRQARFRILARVRRLSLGSPGEMLIVLLAGGDKRTQSRDIERAKGLALGL